jgi:hypothetical protein
LSFVIYHETFIFSDTHEWEKLAMPWGLRRQINLFLSLFLWQIQFIFTAHIS